MSGVFQMRTVRIRETFMILAILPSWLLFHGCKSGDGQAAGGTTGGEEVSVSKHAALVAAVADCESDKECKENLESCDVGKAILCSTMVAATAAACVDPADGVCEEALAEDKAAGCCDCLPKGKVRDLCKAIPAEAGTGTGGGVEDVSVAAPSSEKK